MPLFTQNYWNTRKERKKERKKEKKTAPEPITKNNM